MVSYLTVLTTLIVIFQLFYWYYFFNSLSKYSVKNSLEYSIKPVSVVVCSRNAEKDLKQNIPYILRQNYPNYEVLIIDDDSEDNTANLLKRMQQEERYLNFHKIRKNLAGKKEAISAGIVKSRHSWLLFTDVDCVPASENWISEMMKEVDQPDIKIILGYSPYKNSGSLLHNWIHFEGWVTGVQYLSYAVKGFPYMGVGRNMLYSKSIISPKILQEHADLSSGDDDLTINQLATHKNCRVALSPSSFVETFPSKNWRSYFRQKRRHYSTAHRYRFRDQILLGIYSFSQIAFYLLIFWMLYLGQFLLAASFYTARLMLLLPAVVALMKKLKATFKLWMFPFLDFGQSIFYILFSFSVFVPQKNKW